MNRYDEHLLHRKTKDQLAPLIDRQINKWPGSFNKSKTRIGLMRDRLLDPRYGFTKELTENVQTEQPDEQPGPRTYLRRRVHWHLPLPVIVLSTMTSLIQFREPRKAEILKKICTHILQATGNVRRFDPHFSLQRAFCLWNKLLLEVTAAYIFIEDRRSGRASKSVIQADLNVVKDEKGEMYVSTEELVETLQSSLSAVTGMSEWLFFFFFYP